MQILPFCSCTVPTHLTITCWQCEQEWKKVVLTFSLLAWCSIFSLALAQVLASSQGKWESDLKQVKPIFFSFPSRLNLNHAYSFTNSPGTCTNAAASTEKGDGSGEGINNCELSRRKGREINICGSSILWFGKVFVKLQQSHQCHHHVWMDNLHPVPLIYSATYSSHSTFFYIQLKLRKKMLEFRYTGGMNGITAQKMTKYG